MQENLQQHSMTYVWKRKRTYSVAWRMCGCECKRARKYVASHMCQMTLLSHPTPPPHTRFFIVECKNDNSREPLRCPAPKTSPASALVLLSSSSRFRKPSQEMQKFPRSSSTWTSWGRLDPLRNYWASPRRSKHVLTINGYTVIPGGSPFLGQCSIPAAQLPKVFPPKFRGLILVEHTTGPSLWKLLQQKCLFHTLRL